MGKFRKDCVIDYTQKEFLEEFGIGDKYFERIMNPKEKKGKKMLEYYNIDKELLKRESSPKAQYEIQYDIADLLKIMVKNFQDNPFYDSRYNLKNSTAKQVIEYNKKIINEIEKLPKYKQEYVKSNENYKLNYLLTESIPVIIDKLSFLLSNSVFNYDDFTHMTRGIGILLDGFDNLIDECFLERETYKWMEANFDAGRKKSRHARYSVDNLLKEGFDHFIRTDLREFNSIIPEEIRNKLINSKYEGDLEKLRQRYIDEFDRIAEEEEIYKVNEEISNCINNTKDIEEMIKFDEMELEAMEKNKMGIKNLIYAEVASNDSYFDPQVYNVKLGTFIFYVKEKLHKFVEENMQDESNYMKNMEGYGKLMDELVDKCVEDIINVRKNAILQKHEKLQNKKEKKLKLIRERLDDIFGRILIDILENEI